MHENILNCIGILLICTPHDKLRQTLLSIKCYLIITCIIHLWIKANTGRWKHSCKGRYCKRSHVYVSSFPFMTASFLSFYFIAFILLPLLIIYMLVYKSLSLCLYPLLFPFHLWLCFYFLMSATIFIELSTCCELEWKSENSLNLGISDRKSR